MAIDTQSLSQLISEFRLLQTKDSVTPESLGYILQRITDLLATAGTSDTVTRLQQIADGFNKAGRVIVSIAQGNADINNVNANVQALNISTGEISTTSCVLIQQATADRAGAMRAQHVADLSEAKKNIKDISLSLSELSSRLDEANQLITELQEKVNAVPPPSQVNNPKQNIACLVKDGKLHVVGAAKLLDDGFVPYLFRNVRKRNPFKDKNRPEADQSYGPETKGWGVLGSMYSVRIENSIVEISQNARNEIGCMPKNGYTSDPVYFAGNQGNEQTVGYGRSSVKLHDANGNYRLIRLRFAIGFAKPIYPGRRKITPANLVTPLAEFTLIFDSGRRKWAFGK